MYNIIEILEKSTAKQVLIERTRVKSFVNLILQYKKLLLFIDWRKNIVHTCTFNT